MCRHTLNRKDYVLPMEENRIIDTVDGTSFDENDADIDEKDLLSEDAIGADSDKTREEDDGVCRGRTESVLRNERDEYEFLIKNRFKELYAEDTRRMINRRFRKYKIMEERFKLLEASLVEKEAQNSENLQKIAELESVLRSEVEKAVRETEERVISEIRAKKVRPNENGTSPRSHEMPFDVSGLTKKERADIARRAAGGEKIKF